MQKRGLSQEALKLIACITMLIDHFGASVVPQLPVPYMVELYYACRIIGRIAFPIYCFLLCEGMRHTRDTRKYVLRLALGILLAELPFDLLLEGGFSWEYQSVMVTLTLGAVMLWTMERTQKTGQKLLLALPFAILAELCRSDYGAWGIAMICVFALVRGLPGQLLYLAGVNVCMPTAMLSVFRIQIPIQLAALAAMLPIGLYSGGKRTYSKGVQWAFYLFYPVHLLVLWMILLLLR